MGRFPAWTATLYTDDGVGDRTFRTTTMPGVTLALFPVKQIGVRASAETSGIRYYSEDSGFDVWRIGVEIRPATVGPLTLFVSAATGGLSQTNGIGARLWYVGGGAQLRLIGAFSLLGAAELLWHTNAETGGPTIQRTEIDLDPVAWRAGIVWRVVRFGW